MDRRETGSVPAADPETMPRKRARRRGAAGAASMDGDAAATNLAAYLSTVEAAAASLIRQFPDDRPIDSLALAALVGLRGFPEGGKAPGERNARAFMRVATELAVQSGNAQLIELLPQVAELAPMSAETRAAMTERCHEMLSSLSPQVVVRFRTARVRGEA
jgi:hypothetical protein